MPGKPRRIHRDTEDRIARLLDEVEREGLLLSPSNPADRKALRRRRETGELIEPIKGTFARPAYWQALKPPEQAVSKMRTLSKRHPDWTFCGPSAACLYGLPVSWSYLSTIHVTAAPRARKSTSAGFRFHDIKNVEREHAQGMPVTSFWRTVFDCLTMMERPDALAVADAALRMSQSCARQLVAHLKSVRRGQRGVARAIEIARLADPLAESGGESIAREVIAELGFELPILQLWVPNPLEPGHFYRVDCAWFSQDGHLIFGEHDGNAKSEDSALTGGRSKEEVLRKERLRESHLTMYGAKVLRFSPAIVRNRQQFAKLLDSYGVPRRKGKLAPPALTPYKSELHVYNGWTVIASMYNGRQLHLAA